jgi:ketosteroid isomerase-like protein
LKFHMLEAVPDRDPDSVLRAMEEGLREVSIEVVREGHTITLAGLGPSPRARNRRDRTVIDVSAEDGTTTIAVDVTYQASAFLGETSQDAVVRAKLDRVFDQMRDRLGLEHSPASIEKRSETARFVPKPAELPTLRFAARGPEEPVPAVAVAPTSEPPQIAPPPSVEAVLPQAQGNEPVEATASQTDQNAIEEPVREIEGVAPVKAEETGTEKTEESAVEQVEEIAAEKTDGPAVEKIEEPSLAPVASAAAPPERKESETVTEIATASAAERDKKRVPSARPTRRFLLPEVHSAPISIAAFDDAESQPSFSVSTRAASEAPRLNFSSLAEEETKGSRMLRWSAWAAAIVVLVLAPAAWLYLPRNSGNAAEPAPVQTATPAASAQPAPVQLPPQPPPPGSEEDPAAAVKDWESAMQSSDAAKQAAFYADPVDRYFLRHNLSNADVLADRQTQVANRKDGWMVAMERVRVKQQPDTTVTVRFVKHFTIHQDGKLTSEWFVPSQLLLKRDDGRWQITSERDMGWAATMDELE